MKDKGGAMARATRNRFFRFRSSFIPHLSALSVPRSLPVFVLTADYNVVASIRRADHLARARHG
jgi:hypothetical protein